MTRADVARMARLLHSAPPPFLPFVLTRRQWNDTIREFIGRLMGVRRA